MPDLLSHALIAYTICTLLALRYRWLTPQYVTVGMAGAFVPDLAKIDLVLDNGIVGSFLGVPFEWFGVHTLGGAAVAVLIGVVLAASGERPRVAALLALGAASHLVADAFLAKAAGVAYPLFWPLSTYQPPLPGLYLSTDLWPAPVAGAVALGAWLFVRRRSTTAR
jgi:membrane-bound metal-dependent hydrolase YbcI (DUF457 family)